MPTNDKTAKHKLYHIAFAPHNCNATVSISLARNTIGRRTQTQPEITMSTEKL